jgi:hypothetical protein
MPGSRRSSSDSDVEIYRQNDVLSSPGTLGRALGGDIEDAIRPTPIHASSMHSIEPEEPFTRGERLFMMTSAAMVAGLTIAAVTVVLTKAKL